MKTVRSFEFHTANRFHFVFEHKRPAKESNASAYNGVEHSTIFDIDSYFRPTRRNFGISNVYLHSFFGTKNPDARPFARSVHKKNGVEARQFHFNDSQLYSFRVVHQKHKSMFYCLIEWLNRRESSTKTIFDAFRLRDTARDCSFIASLLSSISVFFVFPFFCLVDKNY